MVGPVSGGSGVFDTNTPPALDFKASDTVTAAGTFKFSSDPLAANKPRLSALGAMKAVGTATVENTQELIKGEVQRSELRKDVYASLSIDTLTNTQRAQLLIQLGSAQLNLAIDLLDFFDDVTATVALENAQVSIENNNITLLNNAMDDWNSAKAAYENNPTPANLVALQNATSAYDSARSSYEAFRNTRNSQIATYNSLVQSKQNQLDAPAGINDRLNDINDLRTLLGLPLLDPPNYELIRPDMEAAPGTPDVSNPSNLPPNLNNLSLRLTVNINVQSLEQALNDFSNLVLTATFLLLSASVISRANADFSSDVFDFITFNLKEKPNPAVIDAVIQAQPRMQQTDNTTQTSPGIGSSAITAALSTNPDNVNLREAPGQALYSAELLADAVPDSPSKLSTIDGRISADLNGISYTLLQEVKLNAAIQARDSLGSSVSPTNPALKAVTGLETINGIQNAVASGNIEKTIDGLLAKLYSENPDLADALRTPITAAVKAQLQFIAATELGEALGDPTIAGLLLLATPGLDQLRTVLPASSTMTIDNLLNGPFNQIFLKVNLADKIRLEGDKDTAAATSQADEIIEELGTATYKSIEEFKEALLNALLRDFNGNVAGKIVDGILSQISNDREALSLNRQILIAANRQEAIVDQITSDSTEKALLLQAFNATYKTAEELRNNALEKLTAAAVSSERANAIAEQLGHIALLNSAVEGQFNSRLRSLNPVERERIESEFLSTITVPQKVKVEEYENRINPLSIPNQIANQIHTLRESGDNKIVNALIDDAKRASREDFGDFVERKRAQDLSRIYLHQTMEGGPLTDTSALPKSNFSKPAVSLPSVQAA